MARTLIAGVDVGNWRIKIAYSDASKRNAEVKTVSIRSVIDEVDSYFDGAIECKSAFSHWDGKAWVLSEEGDGAVVNFDRGKPQFALPLLVSAMWSELKDDDALKLAVSVPRKDQLGDEIASALNGSHTFTKNGEKPKTIDIEVLNTFHEGVGVILHERPQKKKVFLLEIGGGTLNGSAFERLKTMCPPYIIPNAGGRCLVSEVANSEEAVRYGGHVEGLSIETATSIVESEGHSLIMASGNHDFSAVVEREARKWLDRVLPEIENRCRHHLSISEMKLASGGSCLVPAVKARLQLAGYQVVADPLWANAKGLHARAVHDFAAKQEATAA